MTGGAQKATCSALRGLDFEKAWLVLRIGRIAEVRWADWLEVGRLRQTTEIQGGKLDKEREQAAMQRGHICGLVEKLRELAGHVFLQFTS